MEMRVIACRQRPHLSEGDPHVSRMIRVEELQQALPETDYLAVSAPLTAGTRGLIGHKELSLLPARAVVINVGRGPIIDEKALLAALRSRAILGAALDVFDEEPLPAAHPFFDLDNVLLSPHSADRTADHLHDTLRFFEDNLRRFLAGEPLKNVVDREAGY
jgi:phosphoglycerate dehydrogenase-like enzyme